MHVLKATSGPGTGSSHRFERDAVIGRMSGDFEIEDPQLSRRHALLRVVGDTVLVEDLGSSNGTFLNGARVTEPTPVAPNDTLSLGDSEFQIERESRPTVASADPSSTPTRVSAAPVGATENVVTAQPDGRRAPSRSKLLTALGVGAALIGVGVGIGLLVAPTHTKTARRTTPRRKGTPGPIPPVTATYIGAGFLSATSLSTGAPVAAGAVTRTLAPGVRMSVAIAGHPFAVLARVTLQPGAQTGWHVHPRGLDGFITVAQGKITFYVANDRRCRPHPLTPGKVVFIGGTLAHDVRNEGTKPATLYALSMFGLPVQPQNAFLPRPKNPACPF